ncbi:hypothetical protein M9458_012110, partial [Cirrhinus mrigala]
MDRTVWSGAADRCQALDTERVRRILGCCLKASVSGDDGGGRVPALLSFSDPARVERERIWE